MNDGPHESLGIENSMDLLIVLIYAPGKQGVVAEPIDGITKLQKLMFLLQQGVGPKQLVKQAKDLGFKPYKMGPYSRRLVQDLEELQSAGIISTTRLEYLLPDDSDRAATQDTDWDMSARKSKRVESFRFRLSDDLGVQVGSDLWEGATARQREELTEFKSFFNSLSLRQLLIFVYERFPNYTTESTIKDELGIA